MEHHFSTSRFPAPHARPPMPEETPDGDAQDERVRWLFRDLLRQGQVNPLLNLVARYRRGEAA